METRSLELRRQVQRSRYRYAWWLALCAGVAANALLALALWVAAPVPAAQVVTVVEERAAAPPMVVVAPYIAPPTVVMVPAAAAPPAPPPEPAPFGDRGPCPAPHRAVPPGALTQPLLSSIMGLAASPTDSRLVVAWGVDAIAVTRDGGRTWQRVLDGKGTVIDASFDCHGRVLAIRAGAGLGVRDGGREAWRAIGGLDFGTSFDDEDNEYAGGDARFVPHLVGGGRLIAIVGAEDSAPGEAVAAFSADAGETWWHTNLGWWEGHPITAVWRGDELDVLVPWTDCMSEGVRRVAVGQAGARTSELDVNARRLAFDGPVIHDVGWSCPDPDRDGTPALCALRPGRDWEVTAIPGPLAEDAEPRLIDGPADALLVDDRVAPVRRGRIGRFRPWPAGAEALTADLAGRVWGKHDQALIRR